MEAAKRGDKVRVEYAVCLENGTEVHASRLSGPKTFLVGSGEVFEPIDDAVVGMRPGEAKTIMVPMDQAYGPRDEQRVFQFPKSKAPRGFNPDVGQQVQMHRADGEPRTVTVIARSDEAFTMDGNHPLAGQNLVFSLTLVEVVKDWN